MPQYDGLPPGYAPGGLSSLDTQAAVADLLDFSRRDHTRFPTGWKMDDIVGTIGTGEMALMWARSGSGKSTWTLNCIRNTPDVPTLVVNMEMTPRRQMEWLLAMSFDLETPSREVEDVLRNGEAANPYGFQEVMAAAEQMSARYPHLHFASPSRPTVADIELILDDIDDSTGVRPQRVFIDHLGLMGGTEDGYRGYANTTANLHSMGMRQDVALIVLQQTGRGGGDGGARNDGHLPVTFSTGLYTGEQDADWVYGLYRPDRHPRFKKSRYEFTDPEDYFQMQADYEQVKGLVVFQCIKNRPFSDLCEDGIELRYDTHTRRYREVGA